MYKNSPLNPTSSSYLWLERKLLTSTFEAPKDGTNNHLPLKNSWFKTFNEQRLKKLLYLLSSQFFILLNLQLLPSKAVWWSPQGLEKVSVLSICLFPPWAGKKLIFSNTKKKKKKTQEHRDDSIWFTLKEQMLCTNGTLCLKNVKCLQADDFHNLLRGKAAWKPTVCPLTNYFIQYTQSCW